jgi:hypothetical protein
MLSLLVIATLVLATVAMAAMVAANNDRYPTTQGTALSISASKGVLANDFCRNKLTVDDYTSAANGDVTVNPDGSFTYTPDEGFCGTDSFQYTATDGMGGSATATVTIMVQCVSTPEANDDEATTAKCTPMTINVLANDANAGPSSICSFTQPAYGTVVKNSDGSFTYTPNCDYCGEDYFTYRLCGGASCGQASDTATVYIEVECCPVARDDVACTCTDPVSIDVLSNDENAEDATLSSFTQPTHGSVTSDGAGVLTYTPANGYCGGTDSFTYTISSGDCLSTATVSVTVLCPECSYMDGAYLVQDLIAKSKNTGSVTFAVENDNLEVTFQTTDPYKLQAARIYAGTTPARGPGIVFKWSYEALALGGVNSYTYTIPLSQITGMNCDSKIYVVAQAELSNGVSTSCVGMPMVTGEFQIPCECICPCD